MNQTLEERLEEIEAQMRNCETDRGHVLAQIEAKRSKERPEALAAVLQLITIHNLSAKDLAPALRKREFKPRTRALHPQV